MKDLKHEKETTSYMQLCLTQENKCNIYLLVPTFWDSVKKMWMGFVKTPTGNILKGQGKDDFDVQNSFNLELSAYFESHPEEAFSLFHPLEWWDTRL
jgi:hypothetical protein